MCSKAQLNRGQALTEFVIIVPLMVLILYLAISLNDIALARFKAAQVARYIAFAFADTPGSDYDPTAAILAQGTSTFNKYKSRVDLEVKTIWGDMDPTTTLDSLTSLFKQGHSSYELYWGSGGSSAVDGKAPIMYMDGARFFNELGISTSEKVDDMMREKLNTISNAFASALNNVNLNTYGMPRAKAVIKMHNNLADIPFLKLALPEEIKVSRELVMLTDSWKLEDGRDVHLSYGSKNNSANVRSYERNFISDSSLLQKTAFHGQVKRMWLAGFDPAKVVEQQVQNAFNDASIISEAAGSLAGSAVNFLTGLIPGRPFDARVTSHGYRTDYQSGMVDVFSLNQAYAVGDTVRKFHTIPMVTDGTDEKNNEYYRSFIKRGDHFMGCKSAQKRQCLYNE